MITAAGITKSFEDTPVLRGLDMRIRKGTIYGLAGRSGAGKSTLLRCINGLEECEAGSLVVDGTEVKSLSRKDMMAFRKNIGMVFQNFSLLERLSVFDNVALPLKCWRYRSPFIHKRVRELLEIVGIPEKARQKPRELSGGQKQRVAIARALAMEPHILLCDEATSALDPKTARSIIDLLKEINRQMGITIVFVTHQMSVIQGLCRELAILENGRIAVSGAVDELFLAQPVALKNLVGHETDEADTCGAETILLLSGQAGQLVAQMSRQFGCDFTLLGCGFASSTDGTDEMGIRFPAVRLADVERYLAGCGAAWKRQDEWNGPSVPVRISGRQPASRRHEEDRADRQSRTGTEE